MPLLTRSLVSAIAWFIPRALGGFLLALEIDRHGQKLGGKDLAWMALGWGFGFSAGAGFGRAVEELLSPFLLPSSATVGLSAEMVYWAFFGIVPGLLAGAIGGWVLVRVIQIR